MTAALRLALILPCLFWHCTPEPRATVLPLQGVVDLDYDLRLREFLIGTRDAVYSMGPSGRLRLLYQLPLESNLQALQMHNLSGQLLLLLSPAGTSATAPGLLSLSGGSTRSIALPLEMQAPQAMDSNRGTIYVTDRQRPIIAILSANRPPEILIENSHFLRNGLALGGIVFARGNYLLISQLSTGQLYRVPVNNPYNFRSVQVKENVPPAHKLLWTPGAELALIAEERILYLESRDDWETARVVHQGNLPQIQSAAVAGQRLYLATNPVRPSSALSGSGQP